MAIGDAPTTENVPATGDDPQLQQAIKLLQLTRLELQDLVIQELRRTLSLKSPSNRKRSMNLTLWRLRSRNMNRCRRVRIS